jgi:hypothetical protein
VLRLSGFKKTSAIAEKHFERFKCNMPEALQKNRHGYIGKRYEKS